MKRIQIVLSVIILTILLFAPHSSPARADTKKIDGFGIGGPHLRVGTTGLSSALDEQQWMGVHWSREDLPWGEVNPSQGSFRSAYGFRYADDQPDVPRDFNLWLTESSKRGIQVLFILDYRANYLPENVSQDEFLARWEEYVHWAVDTFGEQVNVWEIENEMNSPSFWVKVTYQITMDPAFYSRMLRSAYTIIKDKDPNDIVLVGGLVTMGVAFPCENSPFTYLKQINENGAWGYFDVVSFHPYWWNSSPNNPEAFIYRGNSCEGESSTRNLVQEVRELRDFTKQIGAKPVWITEIGWNDSSLIQRASERGTSADIVESDYLVRTYVPLLSENGVDKVFWYTQVEAYNSGEDFALNSNAKQALRNLSILLNGGEALGQVQGQNDKGGAADDDAYEYRFKNNGKTIIVAWKARGGDAARTVAIQNIPVDTVRTYPADAGDVADTAGSEMAVVSDTVNVDLTERPIFIVFEESGMMEQAWNEFVKNLGQWWTEQSETIQRQIKDWWEAQYKKLEDWFTQSFNQWWDDFQKQLQVWFEQQLIVFFEQLCGTSAFIVPSLAVTIALSKRRPRRIPADEDGQE